MRQLHNTLPSSEFRRAMAQLVLNAPAIIAQRNLTALDKAMTCDTVINYRNKKLLIPAASIDRLLEHENENATYGIIREMFASDVYLRAFKPLHEIRTVVDLGSNRGFFALLAAKALGARQIVTVEPQQKYDAALQVILGKNDIDPNSVSRVHRFISNRDDDQNITFETLLRDAAIDTVDFLKCDVEGGELQLCSGSTELFKRVSNVAMEVHPATGPMRQVADYLVASGMTILVADQFGRPTQPETAHYIYGSRVGLLA